MATAIAKRQNDNSREFGNIVDSFFQNGLRRFFDNNLWDMDFNSGTGGVPVNVRETEQQYELDVIAPGCKKEDFNIKVADNQLTISFNRKDESNQKQGGWSRNEFVQRSFNRSFMLDDSVDVNKIEATYADGILHLALAKNERSKKQSREIQIK